MFNKFPIPYFRIIFGKREVVWDKKKALDSFTKIIMLTQVHP